MEVIDIMQNRGNSLGPAAAIYEECSFLARNFISIVFSRCPREANMVAHFLARNSEVSRTIVWKLEPPDFLVDVLTNDVSMFAHEI